MTPLGISWKAVDVGATERKATTLVFYTTDLGFAVPTLISVRSLRKWSDVDIHIITLGFSDEQHDAYLKLSEPLKVSVHRMDKYWTDAFDRPEFNATHVPPSALARFYIPEFIRSEEIDQSDVLYVDGDTWFSDDPRELLDWPAPVKGLMAAEDQSFFYRNDVGETGSRVREYFSKIGIDQNGGYFNSGVLKFRAGTWRDIAADCLDFLERNLAICDYHDQSALNAVVGKSRVRLSPRWNFQTPYWAWRAQELVEPGILHFVGGGKPWMGKLDPWRTIQDEYLKGRAEYSSAHFPLKQWSVDEQRVNVRQQQITQIKNMTIFFFRVLDRRNQFAKLLCDSAAPTNTDSVI
jgi:lipopolysaccharide biosynthesis glycosyltransferase